MQAGGHRFDPVHLHHFCSERPDGTSHEFKTGDPVLAHKHQGRVDCRILIFKNLIVVDKLFRSWNNDVIASNKSQRKSSE